MPEDSHKLPYTDDDPAHTDFQYLEDLSTAYWYSEVFFAALELHLFDHIEQGNTTLKAIAGAADCHQYELEKLLIVLKKIRLVDFHDHFWCNSQIARMFLISKNNSYMGDYFLYRRYMQTNWQKITEKVSRKGRHLTSLSDNDDYKKRNFHYVAAQNALVLQKYPEIVDIINFQKWHGPVLDIGGGAGSLLRAIINNKSENHNCQGILIDLEEVIEAARTIYPDDSDWHKIKTVTGDFRNYEFCNTRYGLILISNFLHAYNFDQSKTLLKKATDLLSENGSILIHDYFPDRKGRSAHKGALYDLNMLLNTYDGACQKAQTISEWLDEFGLFHQTHDLKTDSSVIIASKKELKTYSTLNNWLDHAIGAGFKKGVLIQPAEIETSAFARKKCQYGCEYYGKNLQCAPNGMNAEQTRNLLDQYKTALLVVGEPPGKDFHKKLLNLEKTAFLKGYHRALTLSAGPCPVCPSCPENGKCRHNDLARPSMEGSGIDVYATAKNAGIPLLPVKEKGQYIKYIGLLLIE